MVATQQSQPYPPTIFTRGLLLAAAYYVLLHCTPCPQSTLRFGHAVLTHSLVAAHLAGGPVIYIYTYIYILAHLNNDYPAAMLGTRCDYSPGYSVPR